MKLKVFNLRLTKEHLQKDEASFNAFLESVIVKKTEAHLVESKVNFWSILVFFEEKSDKNTASQASFPSKSANSEDLSLSEKQEVLYDMLRKWRTQRAQEEGLSHYLIAHNSDLIRLVKADIETMDDIKQVQGWGPKTAKYGEDILAIIKKNK